MAVGWLKSLQEEVTLETEEYGVGTFVYRSRRPFNPKRFWETVRDVFVVIQEEFIDDGENEKDEETAGKNDDDGSAYGSESAYTQKSDSGVYVVSDWSSNHHKEPQSKKPRVKDAGEESQPQLNPKARLASKKASKT